MHRYQRVEPHTISESANVPSIDLLGQGAYGTVYRAIDLDTQEVVAMKSIKPEQQQEGISSNTLREIILLKQLQHKNVVELKNVFMDQKQQIHLVFELVDLDLKKYMDQHRDNLDKFTVQTIIKQIVDGLSYCHCHGIMHRDLKPQNILIFLKDKTIKLADFGLARTFNCNRRQLSTEVVTLWYRAPELLLGCDMYDQSVDMWSIGCIFLELSNKGRPLFPGLSTIDQLHKIFQSLGTPQPQQVHPTANVDRYHSELVWPKVNDLPYWRTNFPQFYPKKWEMLGPNLDSDGLNLLSQLLVYRPMNRISAVHATSHAYLHRNLLIYSSNTNSNSDNCTASSSSSSSLDSLDKTDVTLVRIAQQKQTQTQTQLEMQLETKSSLKRENSTLKEEESRNDAEELNDKVLRKKSKLSSSTSSSNLPIYSGESSSAFQPVHGTTIGL